MTTDLPAPGSQADPRRTNAVPPAKPLKYVLLDRDGVINERIPDGYVTSWSTFKFLPGALEALRLLAENRYFTIVISNQAGVGMKLMTWDDLAYITRQFKKEVESNGGRIDDVFYCAHAKDDDCKCRKPKPGLFL